MLTEQKVLSEILLYLVLNTVMIQRLMKNGNSPCSLKRMQFHIGNRRLK